MACKWHLTPLDGRMWYPGPSVHKLDVEIRYRDDGFSVWRWDRFVEDDYLGWNIVAGPFDSLKAAQAAAEIIFDL